MTQHLAPEPVGDTDLDAIHEWLRTDADVLIASRDGFDPDRDHLVTTGRIGLPESSLEVFTVLRNLSDLPQDERRMTALVAVFGGAAPTSEQAFKDQLWVTLQHLSDFDESWSDAPSTDSLGDGLSLTLRGVLWTVEGLHPRGSEPGHRAPWPVLVLTVAPDAR